MMDIKNIPGKLKTTCSFCVWKFEKRNGQKTKMPYNPATGERAKINDLRTFSDFKNTLVTYAMGGYDGIGIAVTSATHSPTANDMKVSARLWRMPVKRWILLSA